MIFARNQRGSSLIETMLAVGILGMIAYFVVGMLKTGTIGQKTLQTQDDARTIVDNMSMVLSDRIACENTFGLIAPPINPGAATRVDTIKDSGGHSIYVKDSVYGNKTLKLESVVIGGTGADVKTGIPKWNPSGPGGTAFVEVTFLPAGVANGDSSAPARMVRFFLVTVTELYTAPVAGTIKSCTAQAAGAGSNYWALNASGAIYNNNTVSGNPAPVVIGGAAAGGVFDVYASGNHALTVLANGNVGVGTAGANAVLNVASSGSNWQAWDKADFRIGDDTNHLNVSVATGGAGAGDVRFYGAGTAMNRLIFGTGSAQNDVLVVQNNKVGVLTDLTTPLTYPLQVNGEIQATDFISTSDARLKTDVRTSSGLEKVLRLRGVVFTWLKDRTPGMGVIAQEVEKVFPSIVATDKAGFKAVRYESLLAPLIEAVKEVYQLCRQALDLGAENARRVAALERSSSEKDRAIQQLGERLEEQAKELAALRARLPSP